MTPDNGMIKCAVAFFFLFSLHGTSIGNGQQGISYTRFGAWRRWACRMLNFSRMCLPTFAKPVLCVRADLKTNLKLKIWDTQLEYQTELYQWLM